MKKTRNILIFSSLLFICGSCVSLKNMLKYEPVSAVLTDPAMIVEDGSVPVGIDVTLSPEFRNRHTSVEFHPALVNPATGEMYELKPFEIEGKTHNLFNRRMQATQPMLQDSIVRRSSYGDKLDFSTMHYEADIPYSEWMAGSKLLVNVVGNAYTNEIDLDTLELGNEVLDLSRFIVRRPYEIYYNIYGLGGNGNGNGNGNGFGNGFANGGNGFNNGYNNAYNSSSNSSSSSSSSTSGNTFGKGNGSANGGGCCARRCGNENAQGNGWASGNIDAFYANEYRVSIPFAVNSAEIDPSFYSGEFADALNALRNSRSIELLKMNVIISDSPEATVEYNAALAEKRKAAVFDYLGHFGVSPSDCEINVIVEDWETIRNSIQKSGLVNGEGVLRIINEESDLDKREAMIRSKYPAAYKTIRDLFYPDARRAELTMVPKYTFPESPDGKYTVSYKNGVCMINFMPDNSVEDNGITSETRSKNTEMIDAVVNGDYTKAAEIADQLDYNQCNDAIRNNRALIYLLNGRLEDARAIYERISGIREADYNLGLIYLIEEDYEKADAILDKYTDMNSAIAKLGMRDYAGAALTLRLLPASDERNYLLAKALEYKKAKKSNK